MDTAVTGELQPREGAPTEECLLALLKDLEAFSVRFPTSSKLNIFAVGLRRQEIKHSNFLAFLLTPLGQHGLGDTFLKALIQRVFENLPSTPPIRPLKFNLSNFEDAQVLREFKNMDLVVESKRNNFVFVVENKIDADEGKNQLFGYEKKINSEFPQHDKVFAYLTPEGDPPSSDQWHQSATAISRRRS